MARQPRPAHGRGLDQAAQRLVLGVVTGLRRLATEADPESLLGWMDAAETAADLADGFFHTAAGAGLTLPSATLAAAIPSRYA